jgi:hypothetical protein
MTNQRPQTPLPVLGAAYSELTRGEVDGVDIGAEAEAYLATVMFFRREVPGTLRGTEPSWKPPHVDLAVQHRAEVDELGAHNELATEPLDDEYLWCWISCPHTPACADAPERRAA